MPLIEVSYFFMRNLYMKFQNPSLNFFTKGPLYTPTDGTKKQYGSV